MSQPLSLPNVFYTLAAYASVDEAYEELPGVKSQEVQGGSYAKAMLRV